MAKIIKMKDLIKEWTDTSFRGAPKRWSKKFDGMVKYIHFYQNVVILKKGKSVNYFYKDVKKSSTLINKLKKLLFIFYN